ncbi:MAG: aminodeoxychorismate synthase component I [Planctomycetota bacterium]|jgi:para-aminobenzoate synthetase component 1
MSKTQRCKPCFRPAAADIPLASLSEVLASKRNPAILGANPSVQTASIFTAEPVEVFQFALTEDNPFEKLRDALSRYQTADGSIQSKTFPGGWIGFFGYELGRFIETLPGCAENDTTFPVIRLAFYDKAVIYDHAENQYQLLALDYQAQAQSADEKFATLQRWLNEANSITPPEPKQASINAAAIDTLKCNITQAQYFDALKKTKQYITDGDTYQINFSQRFETDFNARPIDLFHWQNTYNPSPYAAFLSWDDKAVVSASPELFLNVDGDAIITEPIKGTRPRNPLLSDESEENRNHFHDLAASEKDQAELAMIVDLERNDLARICIPGTRHVSRPRHIEAFPTVYHALATVEGKLKDAPSPDRIINILKATFPGGSITGAPKIRSMEIIDELEPTARGIYTGAIGWIGINFNLCFNIAIRTILIENQKAYVQTGGGIVADSDPQAEWDETLTKAAALITGINAVNSEPRINTNKHE